jgi:integrase
VPRLKPKTVDGYRHKAALIVEAIGKVKLDKLSASDVRRMHRHAASEGRNNTTAMHCHRVLNTAMKKAVAEGLVTRNIVESEKAPKAEVDDVVTYSVPQARALLDAVSADPIAGRWLIALLYGVRQGEALGLTWACVDYNAGSIALDWQLQRLTWRHGCGGTCAAKRGAACPQRHHGIPAGMEYRHLEGAWYLTRPKRDRRRTLPLLPIVEATLRARYDLAASQPNPYGLVFARPDGRPFDPALDNAAWHAWLKAAGLPDSKLHSARHTAATLLQALGVPEAVRMEILGHSVATTQRGYAHVDLSLQREGLAQLGAALEG